MSDQDHSLLAKQPAGQSEEGTGTGVEELKIAELLDLDQLQSLLANFCEAVGIASKAKCWHQRGGSGPAPIFTEFAKLPANDVWKATPNWPYNSRKAATSPSTGARMV